TSRGASWSRRLPPASSNSWGAGSPWRKVAVAPPRYETVSRRGLGLVMGGAPSRADRTQSRRPCSRPGAARAFARRRVAPEEPARLGEGCGHFHHEVGG